MFTPAEIEEFRADAESLHQDTFSVHEPIVANVGGMKQATYNDRTPVKGKIQSGGVNARDTSTRSVRVGDVELTVVSAGLHISMAAEVPVAGDIGIGWEYEMTAAGPSTDPSLIGSRWLVVGSPSKSWATARRLDVVRLS